MPFEASFRLIDGPVRKLQPERPPPRRQKRLGLSATVEVVIGLYFGS